MNSTTFSISAMIGYIFVFCILILFLDLDFDGRKKSSKYPRFRLWTFPLLINGPFGVVSATEFIGIVIFVAYVIWAFSAYAMQALADMSDQLSFRAQRYYCSLVPFLYFVKSLIMCDHGQFWPQSTILRSPPLQAEKDDKMSRHNNYGSVEAIFPLIHLPTKISCKKTSNVYYYFSF